MNQSSPVQDTNAKTADPADKPVIQLEGFLPHRLNVLSSLVSQALTQVYSKYGIVIP